MDIYYYWSCIKKFFFKIIYSENENNGVKSKNIIIDELDISSEDKNNLKFLKIKIENNKKEINIDELIDSINNNVSITKINEKYLEKNENIDIIISKINKEIEFMKQLQQYNIDDIQRNMLLNDLLNNINLLKVIKNDENTFYKLLDSAIIN